MHAELEIRKSRFLATVARASTEAHARDIVREARRANAAARHHCSAFVLGDSNVIERSSDDGEPSGTAGAPMLEVLRGLDLTNVAAVVTRYFGGTKLGTGGLARAYSGAVAEALDGAPLLRRERRELVRVTLELSDIGRIESELRARGVEVVSIDYPARAVMTLAAKEPDTVEGLLAGFTGGQAVPERVGSTYVEVPV